MNEPGSWSSGFFFQYHQLKIETYNYIFWYIMEKNDKNLIILLIRNIV